MKRTINSYMPSNSTYSSRAIPRPLAAGQFIESFTHDHSNSQNHILFVSHGGLLQLMLPEILTNIDHDFVKSHGIGHTHCIIAEMLKDELVCKQWGNTHF